MTKAYLLGLMLCFFSGISACPAEEAALAKESPATEKSSQWPALKQDPQVVTGKLDNGIDYYIRPNAEPKGRMSIRLRVGTGSLNESEEERGISHFLEHLVFNGSKHFKRGEVMPAMQRHGLGLGGDANAYTSFDETVYMLDLPKLDEKTVDLAFTIMRDFGDGALLEASAVEAERGIITSEYKARDSAGYRMLQDSMAFLLEGTRIPVRMPIGTLDVINKAPREAFVNYYTKYYVPERMQVILTGDFTVDQAKKWIDRYFGDMKKTPLQDLPDWGKLKEKKGVDAKWITNKDASTASVELVNAIPFEKKPDTVESRLEELTMNVAAAMLNKRFEKMTKKADCPFINAGIGNDDMFKLVDLTMAQAMVSPDRWKEAMAAVEQEVRRAAQYGFTREEFDEVMRELVNGADVAVNTWQTVKSADLAGDIAQSIADEKTFTAPDENRRLVQIASEKLTPEICRDALRKNWKEDKIQAMVKTPAENPKGREEILAVLEESAKVPVEPLKQEELEPFAYDVAGAPGKVVERKEVDGLGITTLTLSNGIKVNLKPTGFDKDTISINCNIDGGKIALPAGKEALSSVVPSILNKGGLEAHSEEDLNRLFSGHTVGVSFGLDDDVLTASGTTTGKDIELQLKLMAASLMHPGYRDEAEIQLRRTIPVFYEKMKREPQGAMMMQALPYVFNGDKRLTLPSEEDVLAVATVKDAKDWVDGILKNGFMEVSLVGDFKVDEVIPLIEKTFGAMPKRQDAPRKLEAAALKVSTVAPGSPSRNFEYPSSIDRTMICAFWPVGDSIDRSRALRVQLLNGLLRERLFKGIREKMGEVYSPIVQLSMSDTYPGVGYLAAISPGVLANQDQVAAALTEIAESIGKNTIDQDELDRARKPLLNAKEKRLRDNDYWMSVASRAQTRPESLEFARREIQELKGITVEEINRFAAEIFKPNGAVDLRILPEARGEESPPASPVQAPAENDKAAATTAALKIHGTTTGESTGNVYAVMISPETEKIPEWKAVADTLVSKHSGVLLPFSTEDSRNLELLKAAGNVRYLAIVARPEELDRVVVNRIHRMTRKLDADPYGDCIWGIITGYSADDALRIARAEMPLVVSRAGGTTNIDASRFSTSMCVTDWEPFQTVEQRGYAEPKTNLHPDSPQGMAFKLASFWEKENPQLMVTSAHATQYNLEMPFGKGLLVSWGNRFHLLDMEQKQHYVKFLKGVLFDGKEEDLKKYVENAALPILAPDSSPKIWLAAGNCLFGDVKKSRNTMAVTALSAYGCNQVVGYTVPSWYGAGGWGTLGLFFSNHGNSSLAEAWYLNNQFILEKTIREFPGLMTVEFNAQSISEQGKEAQEFYEAVRKAGYPLEKDQSALGLVHDRDVVAFYGDPAWIARLDESHAQSPWKVEWNESPATGFVIEALTACKGRFAIWYPERIDVEEAEIVAADGRASKISELGAVTNDFLLIRELDLKAGERVRIKFSCH